MSEGSDIHDLDVDLEGDFVSKLTGSLDPDSILGNDELDLGIDTRGAVIASDSIGFKTEVDLSVVAEVLEHFLRLVRDSEVREEFQFLDALEPLRSSDPRVALFEELVSRALFDDRYRAPEVRSAEEVLDEETAERPTLDGAELVLSGLAPPDDMPASDIAYIELAPNPTSRRRIVVEDLTWGALTEALQGMKASYTSDELRRVRVMAFGQDAVPLGMPTPLINWLLVEVRQGSGRFILTVGRWFHLPELFIAQLDQALKGYRDLTPVLKMPPWVRTREKGKSHSSGYDEGDYNEEVSANDPSWLKLDKVDLRSDGDEVEACDLFHQAGYMVHVKRWCGSQTMSSQLSQGTVSTEILRTDEAYRSDFLNYVATASPSHSGAASSAPEWVVYAIGVQGNKQIPEDLPTFSKVNLKRHCRQLRAMGAKAGLARIQMQ